MCELICCEDHNLVLTQDKEARWSLQTHLSMAQLKQKNNNYLSIAYWSTYGMFHMIEKKFLHWTRERKCLHVEVKEKEEKDKKEEKEEEEEDKEEDEEQEEEEEEDGGR